MKTLSLYMKWKSSQNNLNLVIKDKICEIIPFDNRFIQIYIKPIHSENHKGETYFVSDIEEMLKIKSLNINVPGYDDDIKKEIISELNYIYQNINNTEHLLKRLKEKNEKDIQYFVLKDFLLNTKKINIQKEIKKHEKNIPIEQNMDIKHFILVGGYPGSGKTTWSKKQALQNNATLLDDLNYSNFNNSIKENLVYITHPNFCEEKYRNDFINMIHKIYPNSTYEFVIFENNPDICLHNAVERNTLRFGHSNGIENTFKRLKPIFSIPENATIIPVYTKENKFKI